MISHIELDSGPLCEMMGTVAGRDLADNYKCNYPTLAIAREKAEELKKRFPSARAVKGRCKHSKPCE